MRVALAVTAFLLVFAARAEAGTVTAHVSKYEDSHGARQVEAFVRFEAGQGERNAVVVTGDARSLRVADSGVAPAAGSGCVGDGPDAVHCALPPLPVHKVDVEIDAGDGPDALTSDRVGVGVRLLGRGGEDALTVVGAAAFPFLPSWDLDGGAGDDVLTGGDGYDVITPGAGADVVVAGAGDDLVFVDSDGRVPSADRIDGGVGSDTVSYGRRRRGVRVDLLSGVGAGVPGEGDLLAGVENVWGSTAADVLAGDNGPNQISGGRSRAGDRILGRGGNDVLEGGGGGDELVGDDGDDQLDGLGGPDHLDGGAGADRYYLYRYRDRGPAELRCEGLADRVHLSDSGPVRIPRDCAHVVVGNASLLLRRNGAGELRSLAVRRLAPDQPVPCRLRATFSRRGRALAVARVRRLSSDRERIAAVDVPGARRRTVISVAWDWRCHGRFRSDGERVSFATAV